MVKMVTGFHGGGGTHRKNPDVDLTQTLEKMASGRETLSGDDLPVTQVCHLCGALAASVFHRELIAILDLKNYLATNAIEVRLC